MNRDHSVIISKVKEAVVSSGIFYPGDTVIVGVSGGPDSVALLHVLSCLRHELGLSVHAAHFNHGWRKSAIIDERFVQKLSRQLGVPCWLSSRPKGSPCLKASLEEQGRKWRFNFFQQLIKKLNARAVMLAHTQDDLAETVLMHILRGSGLQGLRGIISCRQIQGLEVVRPLLDISKLEILRYLKQNKLSFRVDPTNRHMDFLRNRIRLELLPFLEKRYSKNIQALLGNLADTVGEDYDFLEKQAENVFEKIISGRFNSKIIRFKKKVFLKQPIAIRRMLIRLAVEKICDNTNRLTLAHLRAVGESTQLGKPAEVFLPGGIRVQVNDSVISVSYPDS